jgi:hypothetical protein
MSIEIATRHTSQPVTASEHRVVQQFHAPGSCDRTSYAVFIDNSRDVRCFDPLTNTTVVLYPNIEEYNKAASQLTYEGKGDE